MIEVIKESNFLEEIRRIEEEEEQKRFFADADFSLLPNVLSLGAGVQSSTIALMAETGFIKTKPDFAVFADTQAEPKSVYNWLDWLSDHLSFPIYVVTKGNLEKDVLTVKTAETTGANYLKTSIPVFVKPEKLETNQTAFDFGLVEVFENEMEITLEKNKLKRGKMRRHCTLDYKINEVHRKIKKEFNVSKKNNQMIFQWMGISTDEASRMKSSKVAFIFNRYPLIEMNFSRADCLIWLAENKFPKPPRSACYFCPFHSDEEWLRMLEFEPEEFEKAVVFERKLQKTVREQIPAFRGMLYLHESCINLDLVVFDVNRGKFHFQNDCVGLCGN